MLHGAAAVLLFQEPVVHERVLQGLRRVFHEEFREGPRLVEAAGRVTVPGHWDDGQEVEGLSEVPGVDRLPQFRCEVPGHVFVLAELHAQKGFPDGTFGEKGRDDAVIGPGVLRTVAAAQRDTAIRALGRWIDVYSGRAMVTDGLPFPQFSPAAGAGPRKQEISPVHSPPPGTS